MDEFLNEVVHDLAASEHEGTEAPEIANESEVRALAQFSLSAAISAVLFSSSRPVTLGALARLVESDESAVIDALQIVRGMFSGDVHGFMLCDVAGGYQFRTDAAVAPVLRKLLPAKTRRLSKAAAETLAVIAYKQPVQRAEIESIRGVDALPTIKTLLEQKLIRVIGHEGSIGQPSLYGTTEYFLERFGLRDLSALPTERELLVLEDEPGEQEFIDTPESADEAGDNPVVQ